MKTIVKGRHLELTDRLRSYVERKMDRLDRIAHPSTDATVELTAHASRSADSSNVAEVSLLLNGELLRSAATGSTAKAAFDMVLHKLERQIVRHNEKPRVRDKSAAEPQVAEEADAAPAEADRPTVVKMKRFDMEPMFEEDALSRMDELQHSFFVFLDAETDTVCVLYRRRDGNYGLIQPVVRQGRKRAS